MVTGARPDRGGPGRRRRRCSPTTTPRGLATTPATGRTGSRCTRSTSRPTGSIADLAAEWGAAALAALARHAPTAEDMAGGNRAGPRRTSATSGPRVIAKLGARADRGSAGRPRGRLRQRPDEEEDRHAVAAGQAIAAAVDAGTAPPFIGIRFKSLEGATRRRGLRTLDLVLGAVLAAGPLPAGWVVTLPKVTSVAPGGARWSTSAVGWSGRTGWTTGRLQFEIQVETPQAILLPTGTPAVAAMVHAARRAAARGLHFGTYDYTAGLGHRRRATRRWTIPSADHAKAVMQLAAAGTGVRVSDGSTNVIPVGDRDAVHAAWALHARLVRRSLERGFYQGWDLHPAQLPTRFLSTYLFFRRRPGRIGARLDAYLARRRRRRAGRAGHRPGPGRLPAPRRALRGGQRGRGALADRRRPGRHHRPGCPERDLSRGIHPELASSEATVMVVSSEPGRLIERTCQRRSPRPAHVAAS